MGYGREGSNLTSSCMAWAPFPWILCHCSAGEHPLWPSSWSCWDVPTVTACPSYSIRESVSLHPPQFELVGARQEKTKGRPLSRLGRISKSKNFLAFPFLSCCTDVLATVEELVARCEMWTEGCREGELCVLCQAFWKGWIFARGILVT